MIMTTAFLLPFFVWNTFCILLILLVLCPNLNHDHELMETSLSHVQPMKLCVVSYVAVLAGKYNHTSQPSKECLGRSMDLAFFNSVQWWVQGIAKFV